MKLLGNYQPITLVSETPDDASGAARIADNADEVLLAIVAAESTTVQVLWWISDHTSGPDGGAWFADPAQTATYADAGNFLLTAPAYSHTFALLVSAGSATAQWATLRVRQA